MALPAPIGALLLFFFGAGFLYVALRARRTGELPAGSNGLRAYRPRRDESPGAFHFFQLLYGALGLFLLGYGALMLAGRVAPLPLQ